MADGQPRASSISRKPTAQEWLDAERIAESTLRKRFAGLRDRASELAREAVVDAAGNWKQEASFSTYATTIALNKAAKTATKELQARDRTKVRARVDAKRGEVPALAPVFREFLEHMQIILGNAMSGGWEGMIGVTLRLALGGHMAFLLVHHRVPNSLQPKFRFSEDFDATVEAFAKRVFAHGGDHWIESEELLDAPLHGVQGKPPRDPYEPPPALRDDPEVIAMFAEQRKRHVALIFDEKRERAVAAVVRFAIGQAGFSRTLLNEILGRIRVETKRADDAARRRVERILVEAKKAATRKV